MEKIFLTIRLPRDVAEDLLSRVNGDVDEYITESIRAKLRA